MGHYDPSDELDLISYWTAIEDADDESAYSQEEIQKDIAKGRIMSRPGHKHEDEEDGPTTEHRGRKLSFLRMPVAGFAGAELDLQYDENHHGHKHTQAKRMSVLHNVEEVAEASGALQPGSLRANALSRLWDKLNFMNTDGIEDIVAQGTNTNIPKFVVMQNGVHQVIHSLSTYERGLLDYALPRLRDVCEREGACAKRKFITICGLCLAGSKQLADVHSMLDPPSPTTPMTPKRVQVDGQWVRGKQDETPMPFAGSRGRSTSPRRGGGLADPDHESEMAETVASSARPEVHQGSALDLMLGRIFDKLDPEMRGYIDTVPEPKKAYGLTPFETALLELSQYQLQYELKNNEAGRLTKQRAVDLFKSSMDQDYPAMEDRKTRSESPKRPRGGQGYPPLETAMRSVYREALRIRKPMHREPTNEELEMAECTFHPAINRPPEKSGSGGPAQPRNRTAIFSGTQSRSMSTRDMREIVELQECTFTPNLYKHLTQSPKKAQRLYAFDMAQPQYRSKRRGANVLVQELERREVLEGHAEGAMHIHGTRGKWYWQENLRKESARSQYSLNLGKANVDLRDKPDSGMDLGKSRERHDETKTRAAPRDWGKYIRVHDVRYMTEETTTTAQLEGPNADEQESRAFAETFLSLRQATNQSGAGPRRGVLM